MVKTLIFYGYVSEHEWHWSYDLHLKNLAYYKDCFDKKKFIISYNEEEVNHKALDEIVRRIKSIMPDANFITGENVKEFREGICFYFEIAQKLTSFREDEAIFFAHARGRYTSYTNKKSEIECGINIQYFTGLQNIDKIEEFLNDDDTCTIGSLCLRDLREYFSSEELNLDLKFAGIYVGAFYGFVPSRIHRLMINQNNRFSEASRNFAENGIGHVIPDDDRYRKVIPDEGIRGESFLAYVNRTFSEEDKIKFKELYG